ncbi:hypothetical protein SCHPADRAFT_164410 [Schizopora paradoxa]|uniref:DUF6697 domain-containing protein n=1 Tax=Schizopora paradoxa TaxID=27342 RepID=A0A0H2S0X5_9AGAM|nr:hypothetical protein SCHPADRAFT_164410 [Schizopora paradoxa]
MCQDRTHNPYAPDRPGAHGSHFACRDKKQWPRLDGSTECLIVKEAQSLWGAYGKYRCERSRPLTGEEFRRLPQKVQDHWISSAGKPKTSWAAHTIAAIHLREEQRREPTDEEIESLVKRFKEKKNLPGLFDKVSQAKIQHAFNSGEEVMSSSFLFRTHHQVGP